MEKPLTYQKKSMSMHNEDLEYLKSLPGDNLSDKLRNLLKKDRKNKEIADSMLGKANFQDLKFSMGSVDVSCSFKSVWEIVTFLKGMTQFMEKDEALDFLRIILSTYMDCELDELAPGQLELIFDK